MAEFGPAHEGVEKIKVASWSRSTVADGTWMQKNTFNPLRGTDMFLADTIDDFSANFTASADYLERRINQTDLNLAASAAQIRLELAASADHLADLLQTETEERKTADNNVRTDLSAYARSCSAYAYSQASSDLQAYKNIIDPWKSSMSTWQTNINTWSGNIQGTVNSHTTQIENLTTSANNLQEQIDALEDSTDVIAVYGTYAQFQAGSASIKRLTNNDCVKVLSGTNGEQDYYQYTKSTNSWAKIGSLSPYYSKSEMNTQLDLKADKSTTYTKTDVNTMFTYYQPTSAMGDYAKVADVYAKSETSSKNQIQTALNQKVNTSTYNTYVASADTKYQHASAALNATYKPDQSTSIPVKDIMAWNKGEQTEVTMKDENGNPFYFYARTRDDILLNGKILMVREDLPNPLDDNTIYLI
jgi:hypothetical protein